MAIPLFAAGAQGGKLYSLDDQTVVKDAANLNGTGGTTFTASLLSVPFEADGTAGAFGRFRRMIQTLPHDGAVTLAITAWRDGQETGQTISRTLAISENEIVTAPFAVDGSSFQVALELSAFTAAAALGGGDVTVLPRRSQR